MKLMLQTSETVAIRLKKQTLFTLVGVGFLFLIFFMKNPSYVISDSWFIVEILFLTFLTRTVSIRYGFGVFSQGVVLSGLAAIVLWRLLGTAGLQDTRFGEMIAVTAEEILKFVPVALALFFVSRKKDFRFNASDVVFLSVMAGAGFGFFEKSFWEGVSFPFIYGPHLSSLYFFPDALGIYVSGEPFGYIGHAAATGLIGMGVAIGCILKARRNLFWWVVPLCTFVWVTAEHILSNLYYVDGTETLLKLGGGMLTPWIFLIFFIGILGWEVSVLKQFLIKHPEEKASLYREKKTFIHALKMKRFDSQSGCAFVRKLRAANSLAQSEQ
jgi:hypothetical protein